jgi:hypothetical protein
LPTDHCLPFCARHLRAASGADSPHIKANDSSARSPRKGSAQPEAQRPKARSGTDKAKAESADESHRTQNGFEGVSLERSAGSQPAKLPPRGAVAGRNLEAGQNRKPRQDKAIDDRKTGKLTETRRADEHDAEQSMGTVDKERKTPVLPEGVVSRPTAGQTLRDKLLADALRTKFRAASGEMTEAQVAPCHSRKVHPRGVHRRTRC